MPAASESGAGVAKIEKEFTYSCERFETFDVELLSGESESYPAYRKKAKSL